MIDLESYFALTEEEIDLIQDVDENDEDDAIFLEQFYLMGGTGE